MSKLDELRARREMREGGRELGRDLVDLTLDAAPEMVTPTLADKYAQVIHDGITKSAEHMASELDREGASPKLRDRLVSTWIKAANEGARERFAARRAET